MRRPLVVTFVLLAIAATAGAEVRVFIVPRSSLVPTSGRVLLDIYWLNDGERQAAIPGTGVYGFMATIRSRTGAGLPRVTAGQIVASHGVADRVIPAGTLARDEVTIPTRFDLKPDEFVELRARFALARGRRFESNTVLLTKRR